MLNFELCRFSGGEVLASLAFLDSSPPEPWLNGFLPEPWLNGFDELAFAALMETLRTVSVPVPVLIGNGIGAKADEVALPSEFERF